MLSLICEDHGTQVDSWRSSTLPLELFNVHIEKGLSLCSLLGTGVEIFIVHVARLVRLHGLVVCAESRHDGTTIDCCDRLLVGFDSTSDGLERTAVALTTPSLLHLKEANLLSRLRSVHL